MSYDPRATAAEAISAAIHAAATAINDTIPFLTGATAHLSFNPPLGLQPIEENLVKLLDDTSGSAFTPLIQDTGHAVAVADQLNKHANNLTIQAAKLIGLRTMVPTTAGRDDFNAHATQPIEEARRAVRKAATLATMLADPDYHPDIDDFSSTDPAVAHDAPDSTVYRHPLDPDRLVRITRRGIPGTAAYRSCIEYDANLPV